MEKKRNTGLRSHCAPQRNQQIATNSAPCSDFGWWFFTRKVGHFGGFGSFGWDDGTMKHADLIDGGQKACTVSPKRCNKPRLPSAED